jgi:hypothetical protein
MEKYNYLVLQYTLILGDVDNTYYYHLPHRAGKRMLIGRSRQARSGRERKESGNRSITAGEKRVRESFHHDVVRYSDDAHLPLSTR